MIPGYLSPEDLAPQDYKSLPDLADNLAMEDFTFQEQLLTPGLASAGVGGASSPAAPLWRGSLIPAFPVTLLLLLLRHH
ncbi:hypothetical protein NQZ68_022123 [Dissostichus eleginoides]|nr:hypothetical protein NQZ68_022123 [Dissostichus eleginoides]